MKKITLFVFLLSFSLGFSQKAPITFEPGAEGAGWVWIMGENGPEPNPALEFVANPNKTGINPSATVAKFTALPVGQPWALTYSDDIGSFKFDASNSVVKIMVRKDVATNVGMKFEGPNGAKEIQKPSVVTNGDWEELTFDFTSVIGTTYNRIVIIPDFAARTQNHVVYFDNITFGSGGSAPVFTSTPITFEPKGSTWEWRVDANGANPAQEIVDNPNMSAPNTSSKVAKFTALADGQPWALVITDDIGAFTFDNTNSIVKLMVAKSVASNVGVKFEGPGGIFHEVLVANSVTNGDWQELTFNFSSEIGKTYDRLVIIPDFTAEGAPRTTNTIVYYDNLSFNAAAEVPVFTSTPITFEPKGSTWTWVTEEDGSNPPLQIVDNPNATGINTSSKVAKFTALPDGQPWALTITDDIGSFQFNSSTSLVKMMVRKGVATNVGLKFEGPGGVAKEIQKPTTVTNGDWEELSFDFSSVEGVTFNRMVIIPDFLARSTENIVYFDNISFNAGGSAPVFTSTPITFEPKGSTWEWRVDQDGANPAQEIVDNPNMSAPNASAKVAKFTALVDGAPWALVITDDIGTFTFDDSNKIVKLMVRKSVASNVGVKFEGAPGVFKEVLVANTVVNGDWQELTFDFTSEIGKTFNRLVIIPDFTAEGSSRTTDNIIYWDNLSFNSTALSTKSVSLSKFVAYPNPTQDKWTISSPNFEISTIQVFDVLGKNVMTLAPKSNEAKIDASQLNSGLYFAKINTANGSSTLKLVKK